VLPVSSASFNPKSTSNESDKEYFVEPSELTSNYLVFQVSPLNSTTLGLQGANQLHSSPLFSAPSNKIYPGVSSE